MLRGLDGYFRLPSFWAASCAVFKLRRGAPVSQPFGGHSEGDTPLPIPNRAVKPLSADGTWPARAWESRSPPIKSNGPSGFPAARFSLAALGTRRRRHPSSGVRSQARSKSHLQRDIAAVGSGRRIDSGFMSTLAV